MLSTETRSITEPAGALALAGLKRYIVDNNLVGAKKRFVAVVSGANILDLVLVIGQTNDIPLP